MRVLMLVWTGVATDTRVLREAGALVDARHSVHIIGRGVPAGYSPPAGITVDSAGAPPRAEGRTRRLTIPERLVRWTLLPWHVDRRVRRWAREAQGLATEWANRGGVPDVVHAHDYTALGLGHTLAQEWGVPLIYDTHEYWAGRPTEGRPTPLRSRRERRSEDALAGRAAAIITVGAGVAAALRRDHPRWPPITVVHNSFSLPNDPPPVSSPPVGAVYAGRLARDRELEVIAEASRHIDLPMTLIGPADESWLEKFDPGRCAIGGPVPVSEVDVRLAAAGLALVTHSDAWANHRLAMPNKLFHALSLGVPVVATDVGELGAFVRRHGCGTLYRPGDRLSLVAAIRAAVAAHADLAGAARVAGEQMGWSRDRDALLGVYAGVLPREDRARAPAVTDTGPPSGRPDPPETTAADESKHA